MGTPEFAVAALEKLITSGKNIVAVVTAPDRPAGRGQQLITSPVKDCATKYNIPVLQPEKLKDPVFIDQLKSYNADLQIIVAFRMLPEVVWNMPQKGTFNLHASLLPKYRGAAPINWAIINGETETGVTTFFLQHEIDTGNIIFQEKETIDENENVGSLYEKLKNKGAELVLKTVTAIEENKYPQVPQQMENILMPAPKIFKETCEVDWGHTSNQIHNFVRGLSPYPAAWTTLNGKNLKIFETRKNILNENLNYVDINIDKLIIKTDQKSFIYFKTSDGWINVLELQLEGKKRMKVNEFLRGYKFKQ